MKGAQEEAQRDLVVVLTTEANMEQAEQLASLLLGKGLVACASLVPIVSHFMWQGRPTRSEEVQLVLKTNGASLETLYQTVMALHSYDTPEWITLPAQTRGAFGTWCEEELAKKNIKEGGEPPDPAGRQGDGDRAG